MVTVGDVVGDHQVSLIGALVPRSKMKLCAQVPDVVEDPVLFWTGDNVICFGLGPDLDLGEDAILWPSLTEAKESLPTDFMSRVETVTSPAASAGGAADPAPGYKS
eukprot:4919753-Amphidinium_carterae.1